MSGWSDFVSNTEGSVSGAVNNTVSSAAPLINNPVINPVGVGIGAATGISPTTQLEIGAAGGAVAMTPVVGAWSQAFAGQGLAAGGAAIAPYLSGGAASAGTATVTDGAAVPAAGLAGLKPAADALKAQLGQPATASAVTAPATPQGNEMLWVAGGLLAVKLLHLF